MEQQKVQGKVTFILQVQSESLNEGDYAVLKPFMHWFGLEQLERAVARWSVRKN